MQISKACSLTRASERIKHDGSLLAKNVVKDPKSDEKCQKSPHHHSIFYINVLLLMEFSTRMYICVHSSKENFVFSKGQIISECPYEIIVSPKIPMKKFPRFLP